jgi:saccharopine dehydrogenase-like NADP-dependent oxidoreductase
MNMTLPSTPSFLVFGAGGHIGGPAVEWLAERHPTASIRAVTSRADKAAELASKHPRAEVMVANYLNAEEMKAAFDGIDAAFVITPDFLDEKTWEASNHHMLRWLKTVVVSDVEKAHVMRQVGIGKTVRSPREGIAVDVS